MSNIIAKFDANLFSITQPFAADKNDCRISIQGVGIEPHESGKGVIMIATNGHELFVAYDENGPVDKNLIVQLDKPNLAICKSKKGDVKTIQICEDNNALIFNNDTQIGFQAKPLIDATFPNWRGVIPTTFADPTCTHVNGEYLNDFTKAAKRLSGGSSSSLIFAASQSAFMINFPNCKNAFGLLMPMSFNKEDAGLPTFMNSDATKMAA